jgi:GDP-L-fucose synthase
MIAEGVLKSFREKKVLVTGGTGLIGRQIVEILCDTGALVKVVSLDRFSIDNRAEYIRGDLTDFSLCKELTRGQRID